MSIFQFQRDQINHVTDNIMYAVERLGQIPWIIPRVIDAHNISRKVGHSLMDIQSIDSPFFFC